MSAQERAEVHRPRFGGIALTLVVFALAFGVLWSGIRVGTNGGDEPGFHIDEAHKLSESYYFHLFFEQAEFDHPDWAGDFYARTNPPVAKYVFGAALAATGHSIHDRKLQEEFERLWKTPSELRKLVPDDELRVTRGVSAIYGALICAALFYLAYRAAGPATGIVAVAILLLNSNFDQSVRRGLTDSILLFHLALIGPVTILATDTLSRWWKCEPGALARRQRLALVVLTVLLPGVTIALAAGSKLNGVLAAPIYAIVLVAAAIRVRDGVASLRRRLLSVTLLIGLTAVVSAAVFFGLNPYLYPDPLGRAWDMLRVYSDWMICQQINPGEGLFSMRERVAAVCQELFTGHSAPLARWFGSIGFYASAFLAIVGLCSVALRRRFSTKPSEAGGRHVEDTRACAMDAALVWSLVCLVAITLWLPVSWDRYFLPPLLAVTLLTAIGVTTLPRVLLELISMFRARRGWSQAWRLGAGTAVLILGSTVLIASAQGTGQEASSPEWREPSGISAWFDSPRLRRNLGLRALKLGQPMQAQGQLERALAMLGPDPGDRSPVAVQRCCLLNDLAILRYRIGRHEGAIEALQAHIEMLERFHADLHSSDSYIRASSTRLIEERNQDLAKLREQP